jgi:hypothetical protein
MKYELYTTGSFDVNHHTIEYDSDLAFTDLHAIALKKPSETILSTCSSYLSHLIRISGSSSGYCKKRNRNTKSYDKRMVHYAMN